MNIEVQKYYTDNKKRIEYIKNEIEVLNQNLEIEDLCESYEIILVNKISKRYREAYGIKFDCNTLYALCERIINFEFDGEICLEDYLEQLFNIFNQDHDNYIDCIFDFEQYIDIIEDALFKDDSLVDLINKDTSQYLNELRNQRENFINKQEKHIPKIKSLEKEKQMLIKINKQLEIDYKNEIIILE